MTDRADRGTDERTKRHEETPQERPDALRPGITRPPVGDDEFRAPPRPRDPGELRQTGLVAPRAGGGEEEGAPGGPLSRFISQGGKKKDDDDDDLPEGSILPRQPRTLVDLGLSKAFLIDLSLDRKSTRL